MPAITGHSVLVIGGSSGMGFAVAQLAASQGVAHVAIASSNPDRVAAAIKRLESASTQSKFTGHTCDISNHVNVEENLTKLFTDVTASGALLDHVVYTANRLNPLPITEVSADSLRDMTQFPFVVPLLLAKLGPRYINKRPSSSITLSSGQVGQKPIPGYTVMTPLATGLFGMARSLALDLAPIRVNVVSPGPTNTEMWGTEEERKARAEMMGKAALLGKVGTAEELAEAYVYLMRDTNNTGSCVSSSGGVLLQ